MSRVVGVNSISAAAYGADVMVFCRITKLAKLLEKLRCTVSCVELLLVDTSVMSIVSRNG